MGRVYSGGDKVGNGGVGSLGDSVGLPQCAVGQH
jgi:hypothetical protein